MKSSYLTNIALLFIVLGLFWFSQHDAHKGSETTTLSLLSPKDIHQILIQRDSKDTIELKQQNTNWQLTQPYSATANSTRVKLLLSLLSTPIHGQFHPMDPSALGQFGLASPQVSIQYNQQTFVFGDTEPLNHYRYVMYNNVIYLVDDNVMPLVMASPDSLIENHLIPEHAKISRLKLPLVNSSTQQYVTLELNDGHWQSDITALSSDKLITLVDNWSHAQALQVKHLSTVDPSHTDIEITLQNQNTPLTLQLSSNEQNLILTDPKAQLAYIFPIALKNELFPSSE